MGTVNNEVHDVKNNFDPLPLTPFRNSFLILFLSGIDKDGGQFTGKGILLPPFHLMIGIWSWMSCPSMYLPSHNFLACGHFNVFMWAHMLKFLVYVLGLGISFFGSFQFPLSLWMYLPIFLTFFYFTLPFSGCA